LTSRLSDKHPGARALLDQGFYALTWTDLALSHGTNNTDVKVVSANSMPIENGEIEADDLNTTILAKSEDGVQSVVGIVTTSMILTGSNKTRFPPTLPIQEILSCCWG
jgi:hypothetical protein